MDEADRVVGLITARDIIKLREHPQATKDAKGRLRVGAAVGIREEDMPRIKACVEAEADVLVLDVAHGHMEHVLEMVIIVPTSFRPENDLAHVIRWWVTTVRQNGVDEQGEPIYESAGTVSENRVFSWTGVAVASTPNP